MGLTKKSFLGFSNSNNMVFCSSAAIVVIIVHGSVTVTATAAYSVSVGRQLTSSCRELISLSSLSLSSFAPVTVFVSVCGNR